MEKSSAKFLLLIRSAKSMIVVQTGNDAASVTQFRDDARRKTKRRSHPSQEIRNKGGGTVRCLTVSMTPPALRCLFCKPSGRNRFLGKAAFGK